MNSIKLNKLYNKTIIILFFAIAYMLVIYAPLELFFSNTSEFWFDIFDLLSISLPCFFVVFVLETLVGRLVVQILSRRFDMLLLLIITGFFALYLALYIQGNYVPRDYGVLNGAPIDFSQFKSYGMASLIIWPVVLGVSIILFLWLVIIKKNVIAYCKTIIFVSVAIVVMLTIGLISLIPRATKIVNGQELIVTTNGEFEVTSDKNIIVLVLDTFDGNYFRELLEEDEMKYVSMLKDFTFYENAVGGYNATQYSVPLMLTGEWFEYQKDWNSFVEEAYANSGLFRELRENEYNVGVYFDMPNAMSKDVSLYENCFVGRNTIVSRKSFTILLYRLVLFEYMPQQLKGRFIVSTEFFDQLKSLETSQGETFYDNDNLFYQGLNDNGLSVVGTGNTFKYIHLKGMHLGHTFDENVVDDGQEHTRQEAERACMKEVELLLDELKKNNIYDKTAVVIMADHGGYEENASYLASCPLLLIKGVDEHHEFAIRSEAVSWGQICPTLKALVADEDYDTCVWNSTDENSSRRYIHFPLSVNNPQFEEYEVIGNVADESAEYISTGNTFNYVDYRE